MLDSFQFDDAATALIIRADGSYSAPGIEVDLSALAGRFAAGGRFTVECFAPDGSLRWVEDAKNLIPATTIDYIFNTSVNHATQVTAWYMGLIDNAGFVQLQSTDTQAAHTGWSENLAYGSGSRLSWTPTTSTGGAGTVTNTTAVSFVMTAAATIRGVFLSSDPSSNASTVTLLAEAPFTTGSQACNSGDTIKATYTLVGTSS